MNELKKLLKDAENIMDECTKRYSQNDYDLSVIEDFNTLYFAMETCKDILIEAINKVKC